MFPARWANLQRQKTLLAQPMVVGASKDLLVCHPVEADVALRQTTELTGSIDPLAFVHHGLCILVSALQQDFQQLRLLLLDIFFKLFEVFPTRFLPSHSFLQIHAPLQDWLRSIEISILRHPLPDEFSRIEVLCLHRFQDCVFSFRFDRGCPRPRVDQKFHKRHASTTRCGLLARRLHLILPNRP